MAIIYTKTNFKGNVLVAVPNLAIYLYQCRHVVTAAHCLREYADDGQIDDVYDDITVILGELKIDTDLSLIAHTMSYNVLTLSHIPPLFS